jgi:DNA-binding PucR family transcriptional regulator
VSGPASALLAGDINLAKDWVSFVLGPLADDDLETARLRETLEVFLTIGSNYTMAADKVHVHPNTITYRIHNAQDRLRVTTNDGRIDVALALVLCSRLGAAVLTNDGTQFQGGCSPVHRRAIRIGVKSIDTRTR